jgi:branched-chain amino acid transport system permease protein
MVGEYSFSTYRMILFGASIAVLAFIYFVFMRTKFGVMARATMQDATTARALGVKISWIYAITFGSAPAWQACAAVCTRRP